MTINVEDQAVRVATPSRSSTSVWASSSDKAILKLLININVVTASTDSVGTFRLLRSSCFASKIFFKFFRFRHVLISEPAATTDSDDDDNE